MLTPILLCRAFLCMRAIDSPRDGTSLFISPTVLSGQGMKHVKDTLAEFRIGFPQLPTITAIPPCATRSSSSLSHSYACSLSHPPLPSSTRRSAHSSFAIFLYQTVPQHRQVHSVSRQQCDLGASWHGRPRGAGLHNRPGASRPGRTRPLAGTSFACFSPKATDLPWSVDSSTPTLASPHVP